MRISDWSSDVCSSDLGSRPATGKREIPAAARVIAEQFVVYPLVRGHGLRRFVEEDTPQDRYAEVARWLNLAPLTEVQKNLRALRSQVKAASEDGIAVNRVLTQLRTLSANALQAWDEAAIAAHINQEALAPLDPAIAMAMLAEDDPRSEEHTSELQSLMRNSYAVFCLK